MKKIKFIEIINSLSTIDEKLAIYIPITSDCTLEDECLLMDYEEDDTKYKKHKYFLGVYDIVDIVSNLSQQKSEYTDNDVINAIKHYYENDAFIELSSG